MILSIIACCFVAIYELETYAAEHALYQIRLTQAWVTLQPAEQWVKQTAELAPAAW